MALAPLAIAFILALLALALRRTRWARPALIASRIAWGALIMLGVAYFPWRGGAGLGVPVCAWTFGPALALHSLTNVKHIVMFALFFLLTYLQFPGARHAMALSFGACLATGFLVEIAQGSSGVGHCRMRDLIPDTAGALAGMLVVAAGKTVRALRTRGA